MYLRKVFHSLSPLNFDNDVLCTVNQSPPGDAGTGSALMSPPHYAPGVWVVMVKVDLGAVTDSFHSLVIRAVSVLRLSISAST